MKHLCLFLTALMGMVSMTATAHDIEVRNKEGVMIYYVYKNNKTELAVSFRGTSYDSYSNSYSGDIIIPETVTYNGETLKVTRIGSKAFSGCSGLTSIIIPEGVTSIGNYAFQNCSGLTAITIPEDVTSIGNSAFSGCSSLTKIIVKEGNQVYDSRNNCNAIIETSTNSLIAGCQSTIIPESVTNIGEYAFSGCSSLTAITIPESVTSIGSYAFRSCSGLTSVTIPEGVTNINYYTFYHCSSLTSVTIPEGVTSIGDYAFYNCSSLTSVTIPESVTSIGKEAFSGCSGLTSVTINCSNVGSWFSFQTSIKEITLGEKVTSIGNWAFGGCSLTSVTIPEGVTSIGDNAFSGCDSLTSININCQRIGSSWFKGLTSIKEITLGSGITDIEELAFADCPKIDNFYCYASKCPTVARNAFENSYVDFITLHVPENSLEQYQEHKVWGKFMKVVPIEGYIDDNEEKDPLPGDIDHDGHFTVSDITTLINMYLEYEGE